MSSGIGYDSDAARAIGARADRHHDRRQLRHLGRNGERAGPVPGLQEEPRAHAPRHPQPPPRGARRDHRLREARDRAGAARPRHARQQRGVLQRPVRARQARLGQGADARRAARLPQRAGDRRRADRHHRPRHGLRHHRHRARLRAGEVQEARRRRLLQDHQPRRAGGAARARLLRERHRRDRGLCGRPRLARPGARHQPHHAQGQGLHPGGDRQGREGAARPPSTSSSPSTSGRSARSCCATSSASRPR